ncbi:glutamyl-tRNA reductase [Thermoleophilia bacterium SCSIO 60948]|nr:glutamyl-tRNA reductase [Thermoleophilia bacterium SCSIO 60948]
MSELLALGISHKTAPLELRERLALTEGAATSLLRELVADPAVLEAAAVSTCNRTEIYLFSADPVVAESRALGVLAGGAGIRPTELLGHLYSRHGADVADQLFSVTAGLDSMILGEAEIQGQVKRAYELALVEGATGPVLNRMFRGALAAGKRARTETRISERALSVSSVAVDLAQRTLGDLKNRRVLMIGAGETAELTARALAAKGVEAVFIANRHYDRAIGLASRFGGSAVRFDDLPDQMVSADIVVSSTSSPHHVVERDALGDVMAERDGRPLLFIDLAVPRDIHPDCRELPGALVQDMDDLQSMVERNSAGREAEAEAVRSIIRAELARFEAWLVAQDATATIAALRRRSDEIVAGALAENESRWQGMTEDDRERLERMARAITSRLLHEPTRRLRESAADPDSLETVTGARELFGLDARSEPEREADAEVTDLADRRRRRTSAR